MGNGEFVNGWMVKDGGGAELDTAHWIPISHSSLATSIPSKYASDTRVSRAR